MDLLLDTCTFIWLTSQPSSLSEKVIDAINQPTTRLHLSDISALEITLKHHAGKLTLPDPPRFWIEEQIDAWSLITLPTDRAAIYRMTELPDHHRDPFDRLLVATALEGGYTLATPDKMVGKYPIRLLW